MNARGVLALALLGLLVLPAHAVTADAHETVRVEVRHVWRDEGSRTFTPGPLIAGFENPVRVILRNSGMTPFTGTVRVDVEPATASDGALLIQNVLVGAFTTRTLTVHVPLAANAPGHVTVHARVLDASGAERGAGQDGFRVAPPLSVEIVSPRPLGTEPERLAFLGTDAGGLHDVADGGTKTAIRAPNASTPLVLRVTNHGSALPDAGALSVRRPDTEDVAERHVVPIGPLDAGASREFTLDPIPPGRNASKLPLVVHHVGAGEDPEGSRRSLAFAFAAPEGRVTAWREALLNLHERDARVVRFVTLPRTLREGEPVTAVVDVENRGAAPLDAEYALVLTPPSCGLTRESVVAGVTRVTLTPGASTRFTPTFTLSPAGVWWLALDTGGAGCSTWTDARILVEGPARVTLANSAARPFNSFTGGAIRVRVTANEDLQGAALELRRLPHPDARREGGFGTIALAGADAQSIRIDPPEVRVDLEAGETRVVTFNATPSSKQVSWFLPTLTLGDRVVTAVWTAQEGTSDPELPRPDTVIVASDGRSAPAWAARVPLVFALALGAVGFASHWRSRRGG